MGIMSYSRMIFLISYLFYKFNFRGSNRVLRILIKLIPTEQIVARHPLGFYWFIDSKSSLQTYLASCEKMTTRIISDLAKHSDLIICVGANRGWYPLLAAKINSDAEVHAYEPNSSTFTFLEKNVQLNHASLTTHKLGLGPKSTSTGLYGYSNANDGMSTLYPTHDFGMAYEKIEEIEVVTLDSEVSQWSAVYGLSVIQMDIEGGEYGVLLSGRKFLETFSPIVVCEVNPVLLKSAGFSYSELFMYMDHLGYSIYWIDERGGLYMQKANMPCRHIQFLPAGSGSNYIFLKEQHFSKISLEFKE